MAALSCGDLINYTNIARDVGVSAKVVRGYFNILEDTLLGYHLPPWTKSKNRRLILTEKFYLFDIGITNYLSRRVVKSGTPEFGRSFEQYMYMELQAYKAYKNPEMDICYWRTSTGKEVDFIINDMEIAVEVKASSKVPDVLAGSLTALCDENPVKRRIIVCTESMQRGIKDRHGIIEIIPWQTFLDMLWQYRLIV